MKLLWDPDTDVHATIEEFINAYYGPAAPEMLEYVRENQHPDIYQGTLGVHVAKRPGFHQDCDPPAYVKRAVVRRWQGLFDEAEKKTAGNPTFADRLAVARLTVDYPALLYLPVNDPVRARVYASFFDAAERLGLSQYMNLEQVRQDFRSSGPLTMGPRTQ